MPGHFSSLIQEYSERIVREWVDAVFIERRTLLPESLSFEQLVDSLPEILEEWAYILDGDFADSDIKDSAKRFRSHSHVRFRQGVLIDEVARELIILREVINGFLWSEGVSASEGNSPRLREALRRTDRFIDEMIVQTVVIYAASLRPPVETRTSIWPPPRRRKGDVRREEG